MLILFIAHKKAMMYIYIMAFKMLTKQS